jgi:RNA polymerase sigma-70 factor (ECF subfamily)
MTGLNQIRTFGSKQLFEHAFKQLHAPLYFYALKFIDDKEVAKDLVQDAFLSILNEKQNNEIENLKAYLYRTVRNNCLNYLKHIQVKTEFEHKELQRKNREIQFYDSHLTLVEKELHLKLEKAIEALPEKYKVPFKLSRFEELKNSEIAKKLGVPVRTVETQIYRALKILREKL